MSSAEEDLFNFFNEVGIINQLSSNLFERQLPQGLTLSQFSVLNNFVRLGGMRSPAQLASAFQVSKGAMTNTITKLEEKGCVVVSASKSDGRKKEVRITSKGRALRNKSIKSMAPLNRSIAAGLDLEQLQTVMPLLRTVREYLDNHRLDETGPR
jgi:DNA-binding MarR family transcriptional regulator